MKPFVTIYILCYGNYGAMHKRLFDSLARFLPPGAARVVVWGNQLGKQSAKYILNSMDAFEDHWCHLQDQNVPKYEVMAELWRGNDATAPTTPWVLWLDDDTHITMPDWWDKTVEFIEAKKAENICYIGQKWFVHHLAGQEQFIKEAEWYTGVPVEMCPTRSPEVTKPGITFANGAYVWLRTDVLRRIKWPDQRLVHNGGDTLLGEAIRQQGLPFHPFKYGVKGNDAKRRGRSDKPAGSKLNTRR